MATKSKDTKAEGKPRRGRPPVVPGRGVQDGKRIQVRVSETELDAYQQAATAAGTSLSDWIRSLCEEAISKSRRDSRGS